MNRIDELFIKKDRNVLSVYFTAGYPSLTDTATILHALQDSGADLIEIGIPYSDPVADGQTIQESNQEAIRNGMTIPLLFEQLYGLRTNISIPVILMGYLNPIMQYGFEQFCSKCREIGIDGAIIPDLPMSEYLTGYKVLFDQNNLHNIFLITPQTSKDRIRKIDDCSSGFIYMVSSASITGAKSEISTGQIEYFNEVNKLGLRNPRLIGFGISDQKTFKQACQYASGAIVGSAFIEILKKSDNIREDSSKFISTLLSN